MRGACSLFDHLDVPHLLLSDLVVAVGDEVGAHLGQRQRQPRVRLAGAGEGADLHVEVLAEVRVLGV